MARTAIKSPPPWSTGGSTKSNEEQRGQDQEQDEFAKLGEELSADEPDRMGRAAQLAEDRLGPTSQ